jgi:hypothetical protein
MNGRLYDPKLHRFLQPDNYVQDPSNTQNYNRYGYVLNNPLKYTDPSGEKCDCPNGSGGLSDTEQQGLGALIASLLQSSWVSRNFSARNFDEAGTAVGKAARDATNWVVGGIAGLFGNYRGAPVTQVMSNADMNNGNGGGQGGNLSPAQQAQIKAREHHSFFGANVVFNAPQFGGSVYNSTSFGTIHTSSGTYRNYLTNGFKIQRDGLLHASTNLLMHEYGHYLHAQYATLNFYSYAMWSSMTTASFSWSETNWTEISANTYSYYYFGQPKGWNINKYPIDSNYLSTQIIKNLKNKK